MKTKLLNLLRSLRYWWLWKRDPKWKARTLKRFRENSLSIKPRGTALRRFVTRQLVKELKV